MLKERIEAMKESEKEAHRLMVLPQAQAYNNAIDDAAQLAQEADELMASFARLAESVIDGRNDADQYAEHLLSRYNQYKERTNE